MTTPLHTPRLLMRLWHRYRVRLLLRSIACPHDGADPHCAVCVLMWSV